ncbi:hypothetical protein CYMTET_11910 [Cymbomonas tetramitiformis]|uniref:Uncharacterized protein n=1 Tax=Cymbomonas tetramitiformis TaxID=36881 RepID=A0AAE0GLF7_9CHLO|nr:hypothetical protein CYMTET_11910 [Cymbomonas tetramitiformis]
MASELRYSHGRHFMEHDEDATGESDTAIEDLRTMVLDLKGQLTALTASDGSTPSPRGYTPRADKPDRRMKTSKPLTTATPKSSMRSVLLRAGGKPDIIADSSACSLCEDDGECLVSAVAEYTDIARNAETAAFSVDTFTADMPVVPAAAKPLPAASVSSREEWTGPPDSHPFMPPPIRTVRTFADFIGSTGFTVEAPDPEPHEHMNMLSAVDQRASSDGYATDTDDEDIAATQPPPRLGCGVPVPGFGRSLLTTSFGCALFIIVCAATAPLTASGVGGAGAPPSPDYSPGSTTDEEEGEEPSSIDMPTSATPSISSTNDSPPTPKPPLLGTATLLRVGRAVRPDASG